MGDPHVRLTAVDRTNIRHEMCFKISSSVPGGLLGANALAERWRRAVVGGIQRRTEAAAAPRGGSDGDNSRSAAAESRSSVEPEPRGPQSGQHDRASASSLRSGAAPTQAIFSASEATVNPETVDEASEGGRHHFVHEDCSSDSGSDKGRRARARPLTAESKKKMMALDGYNCEACLGGPGKKKHAYYADVLGQRCWKRSSGGTACHIDFSTHREATFQLFLNRQERFQGTKLCLQCTKNAELYTNQPQRLPPKSRFRPPAVAPASQRVPEARGKDGPRALLQFRRRVVVIFVLCG